MEEVTLTRGNDFTIKLSLFARRMEGVEPLPVDSINDIAINIYNQWGIQGEYAVLRTQDNRIDVSISGASLHLGRYVVELSGVYSDRAIRAAERCVFHVVEYSSEANVDSSFYEAENGLDFNMTFEFGGSKMDDYEVATEEDIIELFDENNNKLAVATNADIEKLFD